MTICIAIACQGEKPYGSKPDKLILISDRMLSMGMTSAETALKGIGLSKNWHAMFAADDLSLVHPIIRKATEKIHQTQGDSYDLVTTAMATAYQEVRRKQIEDLYLSSYGLTLQQFLERGADYFKTHYFSLLSQIHTFDAKCEFIVAGFADTPRYHASIFIVSNPGVVWPSEATGYAAIGSGATNTITYLARRDQSHRLFLPESLFNGLAAKFLSERATGVGTDTTVIIAERGQPDVEFFPKNKISEIHKIWNEEEATIRPKGFQERIKAIIEAD